VPPGEWLSGEAVPYDLTDIESAGQEVAMLGRSRSLPSGSRPSRSGVWLALAALLLAGGCGGHNGDSRATVTSTAATQTPAPGASAPTLSGTLTVLATASLTDAFTEMGRLFRAAHPAAKVVFSFGPSSTLATQALQGAPADVMASADEATLQKVVDAGTASAPTAFARNRLAIVVARGNPKGIRGLKDLGRPGIDFVLCAAEVPCGKFGAQVLGRAGVTAQPRSYEENVKAVVSKVTLGEADAGIVYVTDVKAAGDRAEGVAIPEAQNAVAVYPIAVLKQSGKPDVGRAFVEYVRSAAGQEVLARFGFLPA
jgi:molybdate transport system substrate-binding protein